MAIVQSGPSVKEEIKSNHGQLISIMAAVDMEFSILHVPAC